MHIGVIGSGNIGGALGLRLALAGHDITFSYSRTDGKLQQLAARAGLGSRAATPAEAAEADVVILSPRWTDIDDALSRAGDLNGVVVMDTVNPYAADFSMALPSTTTVAQQLSARLPGARLVKAFNTLFAPALEPGVHHVPPLVTFLSGDDQDAKALVAGLIRDAGFEPFDIGGIGGVWRQEWFGPLYAKEYTLAQAHAAVASIPEPRRGVA